jgi:hypothetical protein
MPKYTHGDIGTLTVLLQQAQRVVKYNRVPIITVYLKLEGEPPTEALIYSKARSDAPAVFRKLTAGTNRERRDQFLTLILKEV